MHRSAPLVCFSPTVNPSIIYALAGEYDRRKPEPTEQIMSIAQIFIHPSYNEQYLNNDIGKNSGICTWNSQ